MKKFALITTTVAFMAACTSQFSSSQNKAGHAATAFAEAYFNYDFAKATELTTPETAKWLRFAASNITQENINELNKRNEGAGVTLTDCEELSDTLCEAVVEVDNYMAIDSIGGPGVFRDGGVFRLTVVERDGRWMVRMEGLP